MNRLFIKRLFWNFQDTFFWSRPFQRKKAELIRTVIFVFQGENTLGNSWNSSNFVVFSLWKPSNSSLFLRQIDSANASYLLKTLRDFVSGKVLPSRKSSQNFRTDSWWIIYVFFFKGLCLLTEPLNQQFLLLVRKWTFKGPFAPKQHGFAIQRFCKVDFTEKKVFF